MNGSPFAGIGSQNRTHTPTIRCAKCAALFVLAWGGLALATMAEARPRAGSILTARASVNYRDPVTGATKTVISNSVSVSVEQVAEVGLAVGAERLAVEGNEIAATSLTIFNAGNGPDAFDLTVSAPPGWTAATYSDLNNDGRRQASEPPVSRTSILEPGQTANLVIAAEAPISDQVVEGTVSVTARSGCDLRVSGTGSVVCSFQPVNARPELLSPTLQRWPDASGQLIRASVIYRDAEGEEPNSGQPVLWVDNPDQVAYQGVVSARDGRWIIDGSAGWVPGQFRGQPIQIDIPGRSGGLVYTVLDNTELALLIDGDPAADGVLPGQEFRIQQIILVPEAGGVVEGRTYACSFPITPVQRQAHFSVVSDQSYDKSVRPVAVRSPRSGQLVCPASAAVSGSSPVLSSGLVTPTVSRQDETITMSVTYRDPDGDPPNGSGYVWAVVDGYPRAMQVTGNTFVAGVPCAYQTNSLAVGSHTVYFLASDGAYRVRFPAQGGLTFRVNAHPALRDPLLTPMTGSEARLFTYSVTYSDADGLPPAYVCVTIDGRVFAMTADSGSGTDYRAGVRFTTALRGQDIGIGSHTYQFAASDGVELAVPVPSAVAAGPTVVPNNAPLLTGGGVSATYGTDQTSFRFAVTYSDPDGDPPLYVRMIAGGRPAVTMLPEAAEPLSFQSGVVYACTTTLPVGRYQFRFEASDSRLVAKDPSDGTSKGTVEVVARQDASITIDPNAQYVIGQPGSLRGTISPNISVPVDITLTAPDGELSRRTVNSGSNGTFTMAFTPEITGVWRAVVTFEGNEFYKPASAETTLGVGGPALMTAGLQMIGLPYEPIDRSPVGTFGGNPPFMLAYWMPDKSRYALLDLTGGSQSDPTFPPIEAGRGYWFGTLKSKTILPVGRLVDQTKEFAVRLHAGWNQVGYVYLKPSRWGNTLVRAGGQEYTLDQAFANRLVHSLAWTYDGAARTYKAVHPAISDTSRDLEPWRGYWVYAWRDCELILQPSSVTGPTALMEAQAIDDGWRIRLGVTMQGKADAETGASLVELSDTDNFFGISTELSRANVACPAYRGEYVDLYFTKPYGVKGPAVGRYATDFRPSARGGDTWEFAVDTSSAEGECTMTWSGLDRVPNEFRLELEDVASGQTTDMRASSECRFQTKAGSPRMFRIRL